MRFIYKSKLLCNHVHKYVMLSKNYVRITKEFFFFFFFKFPSDHLTNSLRIFNEKHTRPVKYIVGVLINFSDVLSYCEIIAILIYFS